MNDPFEQRLSNIPRREVPPAWREEVLAVVGDGGGIRTPRASISIFWAALRGLLWPHPYAWATLITLWLVIAALNLSGPRGEDLYAFSSSNRKFLEASAERYASYFRLQQRFLASSADSKATVYWLNGKKL